MTLLLPLRVAQGEVGRGCCSRDAARAPQPSPSRARERASLSPHSVNGPLQPHTDPIHEIPRPDRRSLPHDQPCLRPDSAHAARCRTKKPHVVKAPFGAERQDEYYWLRDDTRKNPAMLGYLNAENAYADAVLAPLKPVQDKLYDEIVGAHQAGRQLACRTASAATGTTRASRPARTTRCTRAARTRRHRRAVDPAGQRAGDFAGEEVLLDVNAHGRRQGLLQRRRLRGQPGQRHAGLGRRQQSAAASTPSASATSSPARPIRTPSPASRPTWSGPTTTGPLFYVENDPETLLTVRVKKHVLGTPTRSRTRWSTRRTTTASTWASTAPATTATSASASSSTVSERAALRAGRRPARLHRAGAARARRGIRRRPPRRPLGDPHQRRQGDQLQAGHRADGATSRKDWQDWIAHRDDVLRRRLRAVRRLHRHRRAQRRPGARAPAEARTAARNTSRPTSPPIRWAWTSTAEPDTDWLRYSYTSMTTPATVYELNVKTGERRLLKRQPVLAATTPRKYVTERLWATARDGTQGAGVDRLPQGLREERQGRAAAVRLRQLRHVDGPGLQSVTVVSLLDRGMVYAIAHIRGGQEMGRTWYDDGKLLQQEEHLHRLHRRHRFPGEGRLCRARPRRRATAAAPAAC